MAGVQKSIYLLLLLGYHGSLVVHGYNCFQRSCFEKGCMDNIRASQPIQCDDPSTGCMLMEQYSMDNGTESIFWSAGCSPSACASAFVLTDTSETSIYCCSSDLCNAELPRVQAGSNQCYAVSCTGDGCLEKAITDNKVMSCPLGQFGCSIVQINTGNDTQMVASCSATQCMPTYVQLPEIETKSECCSTDLCNKEFSGKLSGEGMCYQLGCKGENCVQNAIEEKNTGSCPRTNACSITYIKNMTTGEVTGAAGCLDNDSLCTPGAMLSDDSDIYQQCCTSDLCNNELEVTGTGKKCYSVYCFGTGCLAKAIKDGKTITCKMDERYGCTHLLTRSGNGTIEQSTCMPKQCVKATGNYGDVSMEISCCDENLCNSANTSAGVNVKYNFSFFTLFVASCVVMVTLLE